jgi:hypothetical protein
MNKTEKTIDRAYSCLVHACRAAQCLPLLGDAFDTRYKETKRFARMHGTPLRVSIQAYSKWLTIEGIGNTTPTERSRDGTPWTWEAISGMPREALLCHAVWERLDKAGIPDGVSDDYAALVWERDIYGG